MLFPSLAEPTDREAVRLGSDALTYRDLARVAAGVASRLEGVDRAAVWARPTLETCVAVFGALASGTTVVPLNPKTGEGELRHILDDSSPELVLSDTEETLPKPLATMRRVTVDLSAGGGALSAEPSEEAPAFIIYTSGTTGPPKGAVLPRRAISSNLDALAAAWNWTDRDKLVHGLPLFHVHGLILGILGPVRRGGEVEHLGRFTPEAAARALAGGGTMLFGVPTMYHRIGAEAEQNPKIADGLRHARLLVSGSAPLPAAEHRRIESLSGQRIVERYGMTETLMNTSVRASGDRRPGYVGTPLDGVDLRLVDDDGETLGTTDDETIGEITVRGPNLFTEYLNRPDATAEALRDGWFFTGDLATRAADGYLRIVGRRATDLIKSGGFKIGAGEIEGALLEHPAVAEAAVTGEPDPDLGERVVAWVVAATEDAVQPSTAELADHVADLLAPHKRPRVVHFLSQLPRNEMGKVMKKALPSAESRSS